MTDESDGATSESPSDAFQALGNEVRTTILRTLDAAEPRTFSALYEASDVDTSAGFAYHLRQLEGGFVRARPDDRYELTAAGRSAVRSIRSGVYTDSVDREPIDLEERCPLCRNDGLVARVEDNVTRVDCEACSSPVLAVSTPPSGYRDRNRGDGDVAAAIDAYHHRRIEAFADGVCPDCAGPVDGQLVPYAPESDATDADVDDPTETDVDNPVQATFECDSCGASVACPVSLTLLEHPAVVAFAHEHDVDIAERPLWNVGPEWSERLVSTDPWCLVVGLRLDEELLECYLARDATVVDHRRRTVPEPTGPEAATPASSTADSGSGDAGLDDGEGTPA
ncbi:ArsR/SmtB family transcription factor [Halopiger goleimassiliensis]|uniref:ArsR/SmtB family transcription factor n=1 Tax=Halopiger goleimassiliensis TaxID=1293048 RepID=UPI0006782B61|nr:helix-turn-helix transcriptional regulator [Halopiger goleimassiliensis]